MKRLLGILLVLGMMCGATFFFWATLVQKNTPPGKVKPGEPFTNSIGMKFR